MVGRVTGPQRCPGSKPWTRENVTFYDKRPLQIKLRLLRWGDYPGFFRWPPCNHKGRRKARVRERRCDNGWKQKLDRKRLEDAMLPALVMEEGAMTQGMRAASSSWKGQGNRFSLRASSKALLTPSL